MFAVVLNGYVFLAGPDKSSFMARLWHGKFVPYPRWGMARGFCAIPWGMARSPLCHTLACRLVPTGRDCLGVWRGVWHEALVPYPGGSLALLVLSAGLLGSPSALCWSPWLSWCSLLVSSALLVPSAVFLGSPGALSGIARDIARAPCAIPWGTMARTLCHTMARALCHSMAWPMLDSTTGLVPYLFSKTCCQIAIMRHEARERGPDIPPRWVRGMARVWHGYGSRNGFRRPLISQTWHGYGTRLCA